MKSKIIIERIENKERLAVCVPILIDAYNNEPWNDSWNNVTATALLNYSFETPGFMGWMASLNNKVVGACVGNIEPYYTGDVFFLKQMFVSVGLQKSGIGRQLLETMKEEIAGKGVTSAILFTGKEIQDFYTKSGFIEMEAMRMMIYG